MNGLRLRKGQGKRPASVSDGQPSELRHRLIVRVNEFQLVRSVPQLHCHAQFSFGGAVLQVVAPMPGVIALSSQEPL